MRCRAEWASLGMLLVSAALAGRAGSAPATLKQAPAVSSEQASSLEHCQEPLCYTFSSLQAERTHIVLHDIDAVADTEHGRTHIKADRAEATGMDLADSHWVLTGHVQVFMPQGTLSSNTATVQFLNKHVTTMTASGEPAQFEHAPEAGAPAAHGHAKEIIYDLEHGRLQLNGDSWITDGCNEFASEHMKYDIASQRIDADPGAGTRVASTVRQRNCTAGTSTQ